MYINQGLLDIQLQEGEDIVYSILHKGDKLLSSLNLEKI